MGGCFLFPGSRNRYERNTRNTFSERGWQFVESRQGFRWGASIRNHIQWSVRRLQRIQRLVFARHSPTSSASETTDRR